MLSVFSILHSLIVPMAQAGTLDSNGAGAPGVDSMWTTIRGLFLGGGTLTPAGAVTFFTTRIMTFAFSVMGMIAVGLVMYAGIRLMIGGEEGIAEAKKIIISTLIGIVLALLAGAIIAFIIGIKDVLLA